MTSIVVFGDPPERAASLAADFAGSGFAVLQSVVVLADLAMAVQLYNPDVLACRVVQADEAFFSLTRQLGANAPCALLVLTDSLDANAMAASMAGGVHAYVADGYSAHRLPALVHSAQARFRHEAVLAQALLEANNLLDERKVVDHAKTILIRARHLSDDDAFRMLRTASMRSNQRLAEVSGHIIQAARFADVVNRSGQTKPRPQR